MPTRIALLGLLLAAGTLIDNAWLSRVALPAVPDLVLLVVVVVSVRGGIVTGTLVGAAAGYLRDLVSGSPLGIYTTAYLVVGAAAGSAMSVIDFNQRRAPAVVAASASALLYLAVGVLVAATGVSSIEWAGLLEALVVAAALNGALARPVDTLVRWLDEVVRLRASARVFRSRLWR